MQPPIIMDKGDLLKVLESNRDRHRAAFEAALEGYRKQLRHELDAMILALQNGKIPDRVIHLVEPQDHTRDYDRVIKMVHFHQGETFPVDEEHFAQFVEDDWAWRRQFLSTASVYAADFVTANYGDTED